MSTSEKKTVTPGTGASGEQKVLSQPVAEQKTLPGLKAEAPRPKITVREIDSEQLGFKVLYEPPNPDEIEIDIIAVHGLAADPDWTWTWSGRPPDGGPRKEVNWLKDDGMLKSVVPNARILRYGYDSIWYGAGAVKQRLTHIANGLLTFLKYEREHCEDRPIIFVGHCFGGLVMQKAYTLAKANDVDYPGIWAATTGLIFIGTPHQGTGKGLHSQGQIYQAIAAEGHRTEQGILRTLEEGNETLVDVVREFTRLVNLKPHPVNIFCFFEQKSTIVGKIVRDDSLQEFVVDEDSGVLHGHPYLGLPLDHFSLNKYKSAKDANYICVRNEIVKMVKASKGLLETRMPARKSAATSNTGPTQPLSRHHTAISKLPFARDPIFAPRNNILDRIDEKFAKTLKVALCGISGNGKTHIATEYAHKYIREFPDAKVVWVNARTADQFERSYKTISKDLRVENIRGNVLRAVQRHLGQDANGHWLMIVDGVDDEDSLRMKVTAEKGKTKEVKTQSLLDYIPESMSGRVLITSRSMSLANSLAKKSEYIIEVGTLVDDDAAILLYGAPTNDKTKKQVAVELARALGRSPQAVSMASAYIKAAGSGFLHRQYLDMLGPANPKPLSEKEEAEVAMEKVSRISYKRIKEKNDEAARLLLVIGVFNLQTLRTFFLAKGTDARDQFKEHLSLLLVHELIRRSEDQSEVCMTAPNQLFVKRHLTQSDDLTWAEERALALVVAAFPPPENEEYDTCDILLPCATEVLKMKPKTTAGKKDRAVLLSKLAGYQRYLGNLETALQYLQECIKLSEEQATKDETLIQKLSKELESVQDEQRRAGSAPEVVSASSPGVSDDKPSSWGRAIGKVQNIVHMRSTSMSEEQFQEVGQKVRAELDASEKTVGKDHEDTLRKADDLAVLLHERDPKGESIAIRKRILEWCTATYGPRSLDTIRQTYNLALAYDVQGQYDEAADLYRKAFEGAENLLAPGSPELLRILSSMGVMYVAQGKMDKAHEALRVALAGQQAKLGSDHPETLLTRQNAALAAQTLGKLDMAEQDLAHVLRAQERFLGADNEATLRTACSLALNFRLRKRYKESETLYKLVLEKQQKMLGNGNPDTLMTKLMLGELLQEEGKLAQAKEEYKYVYQGRKKVCGEKHPDTLYVRKKLLALKS